MDLALLTARAETVRTETSCAHVVPSVRVRNDARSWSQHLIRSPGDSFRFVTALAAMGTALVGAVPMAVTTTRLRQ
jgi:hypothetical protein